MWWLENSELACNALYSASYLMYSATQATDQSKFYASNLINCARLFWIGKSFRFVLNFVSYTFMSHNHSCVPCHRIGDSDTFSYTSSAVIYLLMNTDHCEDLENPATLNDTLSSDIANSIIATYVGATPNIHYCS